MRLIVFKVLLPPLLILLASLAGTRWGDAIGGWLVGLPLTSGPVAAFLALQYGAHFAAIATNGSLIGTAAQACFTLGYALLAERGWAVAFAGGSAAYVLAAVLIKGLPLAHGSFFIVALIALTLSAKFIPHREALNGPVSAPRWDLPARMVVVAAVVLTLTGIARVVGPELAGVLASFPIFGTTLALFAHRWKGAATATQVLRGMVLALYGFAVFFFILGLLLERTGIFSSFVVATVASLLVQAGALRFIRRDHERLAAAGR
jgi:hypothetical protein